MTPRPQQPGRPPVEDERSLGRHLDQIGADDEIRAFCFELAREGVARIDLEEAGVRLCDRVAAEMDRRFVTGSVSRIQDGWLRSSAVRKLAILPKVERLLGAAYGRRPFAFQTLNFKVGSQQAVHSDAIYFHSLPERFMCGVWTALEDISEDSGPLVYRPGSHKLPVLTMQDAGVDNPQPDHADYNAVYVPRLQQTLDSAGLPARTAVLRKGEALVWVANLAHGGSPIRNPQSTRRSLVTHFFFKDCLYYTPMTSDVEARRLSVRLPVSLDSGFVEWPRLKGRFVRIAGSQVKEAVAKLVLRRSSAN